MIGFGLISNAILLVDISILKMMSGSLIVWSSFLTVFWLKRPLLPYKWAGMILTCIGLVMVGGATLLDEEEMHDKSNLNNSSATALGLRAGHGLLLQQIGLIVEAFHRVYQEMLSAEFRTSAKQIVGYEGLWGVVFMICILYAMNLLPGVDNGVVQSSDDAYTMVMGSPILVNFIVLMMIGVSVCNWLGVTVCRHWSAVTRCLVDSCATILVWGVQIVLHYSGHRTYGEKLKPHWWLQLLGFAFVVFGSLFYNRVVRLTGIFTYEIDEEVIAEESLGPPEIILKRDVSPSKSPSRRGGMHKTHASQSNFFGPVGIEVADAHRLSELSPEKHFHDSSDSEYFEEGGSHRPHFSDNEGYESVGYDSVSEPDTVVFAQNEEPAFQARREPLMGSRQHSGNGRS